MPTKIDISIADTTKYKDVCSKKECYGCGNSVPEYSEVICIDKTQKHIDSCPTCSEGMTVNVPVCTTCMPKLQDVFIPRIPPEDI